MVLQNYMHFKFVFISVAWLVVVRVHSCGPDQFECRYITDGCIPWGSVFDQTIDCLRDGSDETQEAKMMLAAHFFPEGNDNVIQLENSQQPLTKYNNCFSG